MKITIEGMPRKIRNVLPSNKTDEKYVLKMVDAYSILQLTTTAHLNQIGITDQGVIDRIKSEVEDLLDL